jgi:Holliday junction resolvase RusA-like endonuclease
MKNGHVYTPSEYTKKEAEIRLFIAMGGPPVFFGPVSLCIEFYFSKPKSAPKKRRYPTVKPDIDNLLKTVLDAMNGLVFKDDKQVVDCRVSKHYGQVPKIRIEAYEL